jgi:dUTP pyrophosphatase
MTKIRGFEFIREYKDSGLALPNRGTEHSAGYDIAAAAKVCLLPGEMALVPTGLKAYMRPDEYLAIHIRSSIAVKSRLYLANSQGIIDSDYYDNPDNEGHIFIALINRGADPYTINVGMRIAQGIFCRYLLADHDGMVRKNERIGGIGSTGT